MLTKQQILEGIGGTEEVFIEQIGDTVTIRPLTDGQWARVQAVATDGLKMIMRKQGSEQEVDAGRSAVNNHKAELLTCKLGLVEPWNDTELDSRKAGTVSAISNAIKELSGVSDDEDQQAILDAAVESFRDELGGAGDSIPAPDGPATDE